MYFINVCTNVLNKLLHKCTPINFCADVLYKLTSNVLNNPFSPSGLPRKSVEPSIKTACSVQSINKTKYNKMRFKSKYTNYYFPS